jgi:hypothetical protein
MSMSLSFNWGGDGVKTYLKSQQEISVNPLKSLNRFEKQLGDTLERLQLSRVEMNSANFISDENIVSTLSSQQIRLTQTFRVGDLLSQRVFLAF